MKALIFGGSGLVGSAVYGALVAAGHDVSATYNENKPTCYSCDNWRRWAVSDTNGLGQLLREMQPDVVVSVLRGDFLKQSVAHQVMMEFLKKSDGRMVYISTVNVFDGVAGGGHREAAIPYPLSQYGDFKKSCEEMLLWGLGKNCLIARLPKIVSPADKTRALQRAQGGEVFYSNLYFNYNRPQNVAAALVHCIEARRSGVLHLTSHDALSDAQYGQILLANTAATVKAAQLTAEKYCHLLGGHDISRLKASDSGEICLTMACTDERINAKFKISCAQATEEL
ncbi:MAG: sugar nucleotide-binding protein [Defluviitaleaceae bacterium]|nr:sugar nucleotide-binding protein [Defluviitaleaceae bacterium]